MKRLQDADIFISPSSTGIVLVFGVSFLLLLMANLSFLNGNGWIYNAIFGPDSPVELIQTSRDTFSTINQTVLGNPVLNKVLFFVFWMLVGLVVYVLLTTIGQTVGEASEELGSLRYIHARKELIERHFLLRQAMRASAVLGLFLLGWIVIQLVFPFSVLASRIWLSSLATPINWLYGFLGLVVLALSLHVAIILLRLFLLRPRLSGGWGGFVD
jgi:hypothetical protein